MFWDKEKITTVFQTPEAVEGDPYIRAPKNEDKAPEKKCIDRETGEIITLWEEKLRYPYKTKISSNLTVVTNIRTIYFELKLDRNINTGEKSFVWNGQNIPIIFWTILGISQDSPEGLMASKWHDYLLYRKKEILDTLKSKNIKISTDKYRRLTTLIFRELLKNYGVNTIKANIMAGVVAGYQFFNRQWRDL